MSLALYMDRWLNSHGYSTYHQPPASILDITDIQKRMQEASERFQPTIIEPEVKPEPVPFCDFIPEETRSQMIKMAIDSADQYKEEGAPILDNYVLGNVVVGTKNQVPVPRISGSQGIYHTHPFGNPFPSRDDMLEYLWKKDKIDCIGSSGHVGTKVACFTPEEERWNKLSQELHDLVTDIAEFNAKITSATRIRGKKLQRVLRNVAQLSPFVPPGTALAKGKILAGEERAAAIKEGAEMALKDINQAIERVNNLRGFYIHQASGWKVIPPPNRGTLLDELNRRKQKIESIIRNPLTAIEKEMPAYTSFAGKHQMIYWEGVALEQQRKNLLDRIEQEISFIKSRPDILPKEMVDGEWKSITPIMSQCRILWEGIREELPYEL